MITSVYTQTKAAIEKAKKVLIVTAPNAKTDAICAAAALQKIFKTKEIKSQALISTEINKKIEFLKENISSKKSLKEQENFIIYVSQEKGTLENLEYNVQADKVEIILSPKSGFFTKEDFVFQQKQSDYDLIITLDVHALEDLEEEFSSNPSFFKETPVINISTFFENQEYGKINILEPQRSSICEIIYNIFKEEKLDKTLATILLTGIISSTDSFLGKNTNATAFKAASELQEKGGDHSDIIEHLFKMKSLRTLKVWGRIMGNCKYDPQYHLAWSSLSAADFEISKASKEDIDTITQDVLAHIEETEIAILVIDDAQKPKVQIRTSKSELPFEEFKEAFPDAMLKKTEHGINITFEKKLFSQAEQDVLNVLEKFQKYRHNLPPEAHLEPVALEIKTQKDSTKKEAQDPQSPREIPFSGPEVDKKDSTTKKTITKKTKPKWLE